MKSEQLYEQCCEAARCLLAAFEMRDRSLIEHQVKVIRAHLTTTELGELQEAAGQDLLRREQLDALDAIVAQLEGCLDHVRQSEHAHFEEMLQTQDLLEHLARRWDSIPTCLLPVC